MTQGSTTAPFNVSGKLIVRSNMDSTNGHSLVSNRGEHQFLDAKSLAGDLTASKVYLEKRTDCYKRFVAGLNLVTVGAGNAIKFENGKTAHFLLNGKIALADADPGKQQEPLVFQTWEQFAAYYLATHW
ncbi:MAG: hypothetical protein PHN51_10325 [Candidatus Nanopelagicales bacterium]|nr:hypothetical protein [Candidatus Nanopelagicales bacterium]